MSRRTILTGRVSTPQPVTVTSPLASSIHVFTEVTAWGELFDDDGHHPLRVVVQRRAVGGEDGYVVRACEDRNPLDPTRRVLLQSDSEDEVEFRSEAGVRAYATLLVAALAEAGRLGVVRTDASAGGRVQP